MCQRKPLSPGSHHGIASFRWFILIPLHSSHLESIPKISHPCAHISFPRINFFLPFSLANDACFLFQAYIQLSLPFGGLSSLRVRKVSSGWSRSEGQGGRGGRGRGEAAIKDSDEKDNGFINQNFECFTLLYCYLFFFLIVQEVLS